MWVGIPSEIKVSERRVALLPEQAGQLVRLGHRVTVQAGAGCAAGAEDTAYLAHGVEIGDVDTVWSADLVVKVKEPQVSEFAYFRPDLTLFAYLHLAAEKDLTLALLAAGTKAWAFETYAQEGRLPLLAPMSQIAGRMAILYGARALQSAAGGPGLLLGQVGEIPAPLVVIFGAGVAGVEAARAALGLGARVRVVDRFEAAVQRAKGLLPGAECVLLGDSAWSWAADADLIVGAVLVPGASAPKLLTLEEIQQLRGGAVLVDVSIDQGGCFAGVHATTHLDPFMLVGGHVVSAVANLPGAVPVTASQALSMAVGPVVAKLVQGQPDVSLEGALALAGGHLYCAGTAAAHGLVRSTSKKG